jgi:hypothetical protein
MPTTSPLLTPSALAAATNSSALITAAAADSAPVAAPPLSSPLAGIFINQHVPLVLQLNPPNYTQWCTLFEVTFTKTGVDDHINNPPSATAPYWIQDDAYIVSWLYNRVSPEIFGLIHQRHATAAQLWSSIATLFMENREHQVVYLATEFRHIEQGTGSIINFFARLKDCADRLADLGAPVTDRDQVLNMFRGLNPRLHYALPILTMQSPFPTFLRCRAFLLLEESRMNASTGTSSETALYAARAPHGGHSSGGGGGSSGNTSGGNTNGGSGNRHNNGRRKGKAPATNPAPAPRPTAPTAPPSMPWTGMVHAWPMPWRPHMPGAGILGARPGAPAPFAGTASHYGAPPPYFYPGATPAAVVAAADPGAASSSAPPPTWDQAGLIQALNNLSVQQPQPVSAPGPWYLDTGASEHMSSSSGNLAALKPCSSSSIVVGNGSSLAVTHTGHQSLPTSSHPIHLRDILVSPNLLKNLISVKTLCRHNPVTVEFDHRGFSVKDRRTRMVILRCDSDSDLYPVTPPSIHHSFLAVTKDLWHQRLGHLGRDALDTVLHHADAATDSSITTPCHACQIGKQSRLPFLDSSHVSYFPFQLVHCDLWTSPVSSLSGCKYYLLLLDDYSHFVWTFPL